MSFMEQRQSRSSSGSRSDVASAMTAERWFRRGTETNRSARDGRDARVFEFRAGARERQILFFNPLLRAARCVRALALVDNYFRC